MFPVGKADQLCITILIILVTKQTKLFKISGIQTKMDLLSLDYPDPGRFF
jgi:hypothetical protein